MRRALGFLAICTVGNQAHAQPTPAFSPPATAQTGEASRVWIIASAFGEPVPSLVSVGLRYFLLPWLNGDASIGFLGAGVGVRVTIPNLRLSPLLGFTAAGTYVGGAWGAGVAMGLGARFISDARSLEAGLHCTPDVLQGDLAACLPYLTVGFGL